MRREYYDTHKKGFSRGAVDGVSSSKEGEEEEGGEKRKKTRGTHIRLYPCVPLGTRRMRRPTAWASANFPFLLPGRIYNPAFSASFRMDGHRTNICSGLIRTKSNVLPPLTLALALAG